MTKRRSTRAASAPLSGGPVVSSPPTLEYKVVELSHVDEQALERTVNTWVRQGWRLENVQFAMRESSKRPAMAFVFFTREGPPVDAVEAPPSQAAEPSPAGYPPRAVSAYERLVQLANGGEDEEGA